MTKTSLLTTDVRTQKRNAAEKRFRAYGLSAIIVAMIALVFLLSSVLSNGLVGFKQTYISMDVMLPEERLDKSGVRDLEVMSKVTTIGYAPVLRDALVAAVAANGIETELSDKDIGNMISKEAAATVRNRVLANPCLLYTSPSPRD